MLEMSRLSEICTQTHLLFWGGSGLSRIDYTQITERPDKTNKK